MIGIGVIGCGYWGPNLVRNFAECPGARVVSVCDLRAEQVARLCRRYPGVEGTSDPDALFANRAIDAVAIATPVSTHFELALRALRSGKHVLLEKPLCATSEQCQRLIDEAAERGRVLMVDHTFVYTGAVQKIHELVSSGSLGDVYYYDSVRVNLGLFQHDVSVLWDLAVHDLAIMDYVLGKSVSAVSATGIGHVPGQPENVAYLTLYFGNGLIGHVHVNWLAPVKLRQTLIGGSQRMIVYDDLEPSEKIKIYNKGIVVGDDPESVRRVLIGYRTGDMHAPNLDGTEALRKESEHFVACIRESRAPLTDGAAGLRVVRVLEAATRSLQQRGAPVELS